MDLICFVIGYIFAAFELNVGVVDILPDAAGFALLAVSALLLIRKRKMPGWSVVPILIGLVGSILLLILKRSMLWWWIRLADHAALLIWMFLLFRTALPGVEKGSVQQIQKKTLRLSQIILLLLAAFGGLLSLTTALSVILIVLEALLVLYVIVAVSRDWPGRTV
ncbi:MAG: hypothetical protein IJL53_02735 [Firmicutes bacterium]|nr:hypothetical protein [Bacillota bacterium]